MTTHERRVMALMRFHGLSKAEAEKRARSLAAKKNPAKRKTQARTVAPKRKTQARTQRAAEDYVYRQSQVTKKAPSKRLIKRRTINLQTQRGVFPNPSTRDAKTASILWRYNKTTGYWEAERSCIKNATCEQWLKVYKDDEPDEIFKVAAKKPSGLSAAEKAKFWGLKNNPDNARGAKAKARVNPAKREKQIIVEYELSGQNFAERNRGMYGWKELAAFPDTPEGSENAIQYAQAYHKIAPHLRIQVVTK